MSGIKSLIVLVLLAIAGLVLLQNQTPIAVVFLGVPSPMLPLGLWAIGAAAVGSITMLILAFLVSLGGSRRPPSPRSRSFNDPSDPAPGSKPPRRPFGMRRKEPIGEDIDETPEVWDNDEAWDDRDRRVSQFVPDLEPPREPWELLEEDTSTAPIPNSPGDRSEPSMADELEEQGEPLDLPPISSYELHQQPVEVYRQGSVYSFSYEKQPSDSASDSFSDSEDEFKNPPINLGNKAGIAGEANSDRRVPIDLPTRDRNLRPDPLDALEEITPIVEPTDPMTMTSPRKPSRPSPSTSQRRRDPKASPPPSQPAPQNPTPSRRAPDTNRADPAPTEDWDRDWREPENDDADWI